MLRCPECDTEAPEGSRFCPQCATPIPGHAKDQVITDELARPLGLSALRPGSMVFGKYRIERILGQGAMGVVYAATDTYIDRRVAIKTIRFDAAPTRQKAVTMAERFLREARAAGRLTHPNIIITFDAGEADGLNFIVMEYLEGQTLAALLADSGPLEIGRAVGLMLQIATALAAAHGEGIVHRDVKPSNVMVLPGDKVKVTDFGIAKVLEDSSHVTGSDVVVGTPRYISPEQVQGLPIDGRADLYSLATVFYECLTGLPPHLGISVHQTLYRIVSTPHEPVRLDDVTMSRACNAFFDRALAKEPAKRYPNAAAFSAALQELLHVTDTTETGRRRSRTAEQRGFSPVETDPATAAANPGEPTITVGRMRAVDGETGGAGASLVPGERYLVLNDESHMEAPAVPGRYLFQVLISVVAIAAVGAALYEGTLLGAGRPAADLPEAVVVAASPTAAWSEQATSTAADFALAPLASATPLANPALLIVTPTASPSAPTAGSSALPTAAALRQETPAVAASAESGEVYVKIDPWALISVDGRPSGYSPPAKVLALPPGPHTVRIENTALKVSLDRPINVRPRDRVSIVINLNEGWLSVKSTPASLVLIDGHELGSTPVEGHSLNAGRYRLRLAAPGYRDYDAVIEILPQRLLPVDQKLEPLP
ncbi:MAG: protein kinase [Candidatus Schekmanbacteria bacterium]|nr:protein kinase [Candidatus Schekmanbacteria bacterium]